MYQGAVTLSKEERVANYERTKTNRHLNRRRRPATPSQPKYNRAKAKRHASDSVKKARAAVKIRLS